MARTHFFPFTPSTSTDLRPSVCQHPFSLADHRATKRVKKRGSSQPRHANVNSRQIPVDRSLRDLVFFPHAAPYIHNLHTEYSTEYRVWYRVRSTDTDLYLYPFAAIRPSSQVAGSRQEPTPGRSPGHEVLRFQEAPLSASTPLLCTDSPWAV